MADALSEEGCSSIVAKNDNPQKRAKILAKGALDARRRADALKNINRIASPMPMFNRRSFFIGITALLVSVIGVVLLPKIMSSGVSRYKPDNRRRSLLAKKVLDSLTIALGRYRFHVGAYPTSEEGLEVLAYRRPEDLRKIRRVHPGWDGPYVTGLVKDPWGRKYVYEVRSDTRHPILYSCGPDGKAGTADDLFPNKLAFDLPFRDMSWTNNWVSVESRRGVLKVVPVYYGGKANRSD